MAAGAAEAPPAATLIAAGDIASCGSEGDEATAGLVQSLPGTVAALGDTVYELGSAEEYTRCYAPSWGRFRSRTLPVPGNHEYGTPGAAGYFAYFGRRAGDPARGYYSYRLGSWHVVALNSNCGPAGGCELGSPQERWLAADLRGHRSLCTAAYWHHPRFSSGLHGDDVTMRDLWRTLERAHADVVLSGHDHDYERFAPQTAEGRRSARGITQFVVGTGGRSRYPVLGRARNSQVASSSSFGVLRLTLLPDRYRWRFLPTRTGGFTDSGERRCR